MSKMLPATCVAGVVTAEGVPVPAAEILSEGVGQSSGILIVDEEEARYIGKTTPDLKTTLEQVAVALGQTSTALTQIVTALGTVSAATVPPTTAGIAANVAAISAAVVQITSAQTALTTLKEVLK